MHVESFLFQAFIYLMAAVISVPVAKKMGLGSVLGYLIAGILIGPFVLGLSRQGNERCNAFCRVRSRINAFFELGSN